MTQRYVTHDNGAEPFCVVVEGGNIRVYQQEYVEEARGDRWYVDETKPPVWTCECPLRVLPGVEPSDPALAGNSVLVETAPYHYVYIGSTIFSFRAVDEIQQYYSPIGNSDVPYPYAVGSEYTYLMLDHVMMPNTERIDDDPYRQFYDMFHWKICNAKGKKRAQLKQAEADYKGRYGVQITTIVCSPYGPDHDKN